MTGSDDRTRFLAAYDEHLRTDAETPSAVSVTRLGPLRLVTFVHGRGFVTYRDLEGADTDAVRGLVAEAMAYYRSDPDITRVEWKTRGHDHTPGLHEALLANGFTPDEPESIMIGLAKVLGMDVPLPAGVTLRRISGESDVRAMSAMQDEVFGAPPSDEAEGRIVSAGRLEPVPGTIFAGVWGGATRPEWRGRGIYRALTARRARAALDMGKTLIHSDSTEFSRPILERSGLLTVSTTTPYQWRR